MDLTETFCLVDTFCLALGRTRFPRTRGPASRLFPSEVITICIVFHRFRFRNFKFFYSFYVRTHLKKEFPHLVSYSHFLQLAYRLNPLIYAFLHASFGSSTKVNFIDSTPISVCHPNRANSHATFHGLAAWGKTSTGFFFGFKLHLVINEAGALINVVLSSGNDADQKVAEALLSEDVVIQGKVYGDRGYVSRGLADRLQQKGIFLITKKRNNMKAEPLKKEDEVNLSKRFLIETVIGQLKQTCSYIEHHRQRSLQGFIMNLLSGLVSYNIREEKPSMNRCHPFPGKRNFRGKTIEA